MLPYAMMLNINPTANLATYDASTVHPANASRDVDFFVESKLRYLPDLPQMSVMESQR